MKIIGKRVLVQRIKQEEVTKSGLILATNQKKVSHEGTVVNIGDLDCVNIGDYIYFTSYSGTEVKIDDVDYVVVNLDDILAVK